MTKRLSVLSMVLAATFAAVTPALGQSNFSISYLLADGNAHALGAGTNIAFPSVDINATTPASTAGHRPLFAPARSVAPESSPSSETSEAGSAAG